MLCVCVGDVMFTVVKLCTLGVLALALGVSLVS